jgi:8-oxo-dGTP pyrophosphatase MutT (NUDIX family)
VLLMNRGEIVDSPGGGLFRGAFFETDFRNFLSWRDFGFPDRSVHNCFAMAALRSSDGAWLLGEMGAHTSSPGQIYFAAGTPDRNDIVGQTVDLSGSVVREMQEETGFSADDAPGLPGWRIVVAGPRIACMQERILPLTATEACARTAAYIAADPDPELASLKAVRGLQDFHPELMPDFIQMYLRDVLSERQPG